MSKKKTTLKKGSILTEEMLQARITPIEHFESITPAAAELLAIEGKHVAYESHDLEWLKNVSNEVAKNLSRSKVWYKLDLNGLDSLSDEAAEALAKFKGEGGVSLNGLSVLSDKAAEALAKLKGEELSLNSLSSLSDKAAEALGKFKGKKLLIGGRSTSGEYSKYDQDTGIWGGGLSGLSDKAAEALAKFKGEELYLNGLISLTDKAAEVLAKSKAALFLNGVISLPDGAAAALAACKRKVELRGLNSLSEQGSLSLSENKSIVISDQLTRQIENVVKNHAKTSSTLTSKDQSKIRKLIMTQNADNVDFACNLLTSLNASEGDWLKLFPQTRIFKLLSNFEEPKIWNTLATAMKLHGRLYEELKSQVQKRVNTSSYDYAVHQRYSDFLSDLIEVANDDVMDVLNFAREGLVYPHHYGQSRKLSDDLAFRLSRYKGNLILNTPSLLDTPGHIALAGGAAKELSFVGLEELSVKAAENLAARKQQSFHFDTIKTLAADTAAALSKFKGEELRFDELTTLSVDAAKNLAKYKGNLLIFGSLSDETIVSLAANKKGCLSLTIDSEKAIKALALHEGELHLSLGYNNGGDYLDSIVLSETVAESLSKHKGEINYRNARKWVESHYNKKEGRLAW